MRKPNKDGMKNKKYRFSKLAENDIGEILDFTYAEWGERQADKYAAQFTNRFQWLAENPNLGKRRDEIETEYRSFNEGKHTIFYRVVGEDIEIIGIPHQSMDIEQHLSLEKNPELTHEWQDVEPPEAD